MPKRQLISFFTIFFVLYALINFYIFIHGLNSVNENFKPAFIVIYLILALSFFIGRFLEKRSISVFSEFFIWTGSFWFAAMLYFFIAVFLTDTALLFDLAFHFFTREIAADLFYSVIATVILVIIIGYINAKNVRLKPLTIQISHKENAKPRKYKIVSVSDIHLGTIIGTKRLKNIVKKINFLDADIVLFPGDVVDEDITPVIRQNLGELLKTIKSKFGVYSVTGNHEYIGGVEKAVKYLSEHGVKVLRDETVLLDNNLYIVGREDISIRGFAGKQRAELKELVNNIDADLPVILMDHQPYNLGQAVNNNIDIQLSGHTHHGQLWPLSYITKKIYEVSWGYLKKGNTHFYVSCGAGTWGPPVRIGNTPEIVNITLEII